MINITGNPLYDGFIEGALFIPQWVGGLISPNMYAVGFWFGIILFIVIALRFLFGWD